ncbi:MAG: citrate/2-methylcitrate synthase [Actinomycetota bacterium]
MTEKGLREVVAADTQISDIDGALGRLWYVGYDIADLVEHATYEEIVYLLHHLDLPTRDQLDELNEFLIDERELSPFLANLMYELAQQTSPMSMLRTGISAASAYDPDGWDPSAEAQLRKALRLIAKSPTLIAYYHRLRTGQDVLPPNPKLPHAANFLWMLLGEEPSAEDAVTLDSTFVLYADHTMNASTFTARIIASTLADMFSAITGAVAALKGPLHGGANEGAMKMLEEIGSPDRAEAYVHDRLERREKIMGFGHAVYTVIDPRAKVLKQLSQETAERHDDLLWYEISEAIEKTVMEQKGLYPNVDFYAASVYHVLGIPTDLMTPIFAAARMAGWTAHVREQYKDNKVIRPASEYIGPRDRTYTPIEGRVSSSAD